MLSRLFRLAEHKSTVSRELQAGLTTFTAMAYILAVNPLILKDTGMPQAALITVTALTAAISTALMALMTNFPLALAPGMGINAYFTYTICLGAGVPWQSALGLVFVNGCLFLLLSLTGIREKIVNSIPYSLKIAITCGVGLFIAFIGLKNAGIVVSNPATFVAQGDFGSPPVALAFFGIVLTAVLVSRRVPGSIVLSILAVTLIGVFVPDGKGGHVTTLPSFTGLFSLPASPEPVFFKLNFDFLLNDFAKALPILITLLIVDMFDNIGTLIGVTKRAGLLQPDGTLPKAGRALVADSFAAIISSLFGTSTVVSYIESASGVEAGGRTGLTAMTTAVCFLFALFLTPLILAIPAVATAPALVVVGVFMFQTVAEIKLDDFTETMPAVVTLLCIPLTFSIAEGLGLGVIALTLIALCTGRARSLSAFTYGLAALFFLHIFWGLFKPLWS
ncbi:guanine permease [Nibricoccus aquaticus]|uniref:Guanine permease n=1 Tax=Nibricoccus aquaticus TaxID=2576891 RepID=A0A290QJU6_9BACT|nr:NCS2 family permease [Nibricoccus aquaticus]ATC65608.1 guanine permease [Nibricoccus aquaticus]